MAPLQPGAKIAVLGAGITGIQVAAQFLEAGFDVTVFDKEPRLGGVWGKAYDGAATQISVEHYTIVGYPWPQGTPQYPTAAQIVSYITEYAKDAGVMPRIRPSTEVVQLLPEEGSPVGSSGWKVVYKPVASDGSPMNQAAADAADLQASGARTEHFDHVVVATGVNSNPRVPAWVDTVQRGFSGKLLYTTQIPDASITKGKRVAVVGAGKSAFDVAMACARSGAADVSVVLRRRHWMVPQVMPDGSPGETPFYVRCGRFLHPPWHRVSRVYRALYVLTKPLVALFWIVLGNIMSRLAYLPELPPPAYKSFCEGAARWGPGLYDMPQLQQALKSGAVKAVQGEVVGAQGRELQLSNGQSLQADFLILAIGWHGMERTLLPEHLRDVRVSGLDENVEKRYLYKMLLPPRLEGLSFVGLYPTFSVVLMGALQAQWLVAYLTGRLREASVEEREADISGQKAMYASYPFPLDGTYLLGQDGAYIDELCEDLGKPQPGWFDRRWFQFFTRDEDYHDIFPHHLQYAGKAAARRLTTAQAAAPHGSGHVAGEAAKDKAV